MSKLSDKTNYQVPQSPPPTLSADYVYLDTHFVAAGQYYTHYGNDWTAVAQAESDFIVTGDLNEPPEVSLR